VAVPEQTAVLRLSAQNDAVFGSEYFIYLCSVAQFARTLEARPATSEERVTNGPRDASPREANLQR
jgi:hypothetical protein